MLLGTTRLRWNAFNTRSRPCGWIPLGWNSRLTTYRGCTVANLLEVRDLRVSLNLARMKCRAWPEVFDIAEQGQTLALVGESGCGKSA